MRPSARALVLLLSLAAVHAGEQPSAAPAAGAARLQRRVLTARRARTASAPAPAAAAVPTPASAPAPAPAADVAQPQAGRAPRSAASANDRWLQFMSDYLQKSGDFSYSSSIPNWPKGAVMVDLPVASDGAGRPAAVPVLVLPVPVPAPGGECSANRDRDDYDRYEDEPRPRPRPRPSYDEPRRRARPDERRERPDARRERRPDRYDTRRYRDDDDDFDDQYPRRPSSAPERRPAPALQPDFSNTYQEPLKKVSPPTMPQVNSDLLVELFRAQQPIAPHLPPVLVRDRRYVPAPAPAPAPSPPPPAPHVAVLPPSPTPGYLPPRGTPPPPAPRTPPPPRFDQPLVMRAELTVHRADYTEPLTAWWDPTTGNSRVDSHDGATSIYRTIRSNEVHRVVMRIDRTGEADTTRCTVMRGRAAADRRPPVLPDMHPFTFDGYVETERGGAERWRHTARGAGAAGEQLTTRHELLLTRGHNNSALPIRYSVGVDSSVLGADCDGHVLRYLEAYHHAPDAALLAPDIEHGCGAVEHTEDEAAVDPLREFTMLQRDPRHDRQFQQYVKEYERVYADSKEEAVRMNLLMQTSRFVSAANRAGATFSMALNFLSDRLGAELEALLGVVLDDEHFPAERFPHSRASLRALEDELPDQFDWRDEGGVSPVGYQGSCSSCWAFAVTGAVEGALFRVTRRLTPLSEQALVDCAQPYGGRGCGGTWPSHAYDYVQDRGLPAKNEYIPYMARVLQCQDKRVKPVTQISAHVNVTQHSVPALKVAIRRHAPTVVIIDAMLKSFQTYKSGVFYDDRCAKTKEKLKHAVLAVGWGVQKGETHFVLKNSWSAAWGAGGYVRVHGPSNTCGVLALPSYPRLERDDVLRQP